MEELNSWPDIPFDESMIRRGVIIHCPEEDTIAELFDTLKSIGVRWAGHETMDTTYWGQSREDTCYRIRSDKCMYVGDTVCYQNGRYNDYIKCTFYGTESEPEISDTSFEGIICRGG